MKGYWFQRRPSSSRTSHSKSQDSVSVSSQKRDRLVPSSKQPYLSWLTNLTNFLIDKVDSLNKRHTFLDLLIAPTYNQTKIRCFEHNSDIILYCVHQKQLLCSQCAYALQKHKNHEIREIGEVVWSIEKNIKMWKSDTIQKRNILKHSERFWDDTFESFKSIKKGMLEKLNGEFDRLSGELSKKYLELKNQIECYSGQYGEKIGKIAQSYTNLKKNICPDKYPIPVMKHICYQYVNKVCWPGLEGRSEEHKVERMMKGYSNHLEQIVKRMR